MSWSVGELVGYVRVPGAAEADAQILGLQRSLTLTDETLKRTGASLSSTEARLAGAGRQANVAAAGSSRLRAAQLSQISAAEKYNRVLADENASVGKLAAAEASLVRANQRVMASQPRFAPVATEALAAERGISRFQSGLASAVSTGAKFGLMLGGFELARKGFELAQSGKELTTSLNGVQAAAGATDTQMGKVRSTAIGLGKDMRVPAATAVDAADAINDLVRAGMSLPRAMAAARPALLLASAAQVDTADAARYLGDTLDDFQLPASQAVHVANSLAGAATSAGGGLTDMFTALKYVGPYARAAGVDVDSIVAAIAELAKGGIQGSMAGTGLRMMLQSLAKASPQAQAALHDLGVEAWDAQGRFVGLPALFGQLHDAQERFGPDSQKFLKDISTAFGARAATIVASFAHRGVEGYNQFVARVKSGDVQHYADVMNRGVAAGFAQIHKELVAFAIDGWDKAEPAVAAAVNWIGKNLPAAFHTLGDVVGPTVHLVGGSLVAAWHGLVMVLGPVASALGTVTHFLGEHNGLTTGVVTGVLAMWAAWKGYQIATTALHAIQDGVAVLGGRLASGMTSVRAYGAGVQATFAGNATEAQLTSRIMQAEFAKIEAAAMQEAATVDRAAAMEAVAYADKVAASTTASDAEVAAADKAAAAALAQARVSAVAARSVVVSAEEAAAGVAAAGDTAAIGWGAMLGPVGLVAAGLSVAAIAFTGSGNNAAAAAAQVASYTDAIKQDSGALGENTRALVTHSLQQAGALDAARKLGISLPLVTDAALGNADAYRQVTAAAGLYSYGLYGSTKNTHDQVAAAKTLIGALGDQSGAVGKAVQAYKNESAANKASGAAADDHKSKLSALAAALQAQSQASHWVVSASGSLVQTTGNVKDAADAATAALQAQTAASQALKQAQDLLNGVAVSLENSTDDYTIGLGNLANKTSLATDAAGKQTASLSKSTVAGATNRKMLTGLVEQAKAQAQAYADNIGKTKDFGTALAAGNQQLGRNEQALRTAAHAAGMNDDSVNALIKSVGRLSTIHAMPKVGVNTTPAEVAAGQIQARIDAIRQGKVPGLTANTANGRMVIAELQQEIDDLRQPRVPYIDVYTQGAIDKIHALFSSIPSGTYHFNVEADVSAHNAQYGPGKAAGGPIVGPGTDTSDSVPILASRDEHMWTAREVRAAGGHSAVRAIRSAVMTGGLRGFASGGAISPSDAKARADAIHAAKVEISTTDLHEFTSAIKDTTAALVSAEATLVKAVKAASASSHLLDTLAWQQGQLVGLAKRRDVVDQQLSTAWAHRNQVYAAYMNERSTVNSAVMGSFDVTASGTGFDGQQPVTIGSMIAQAQQAKLTAQRWNDELEKLHASGSISNSVYRQLKEKGPSDVAQVDALFHATKAQAQALSSAYSGLQQIAGTAGYDTGQALYGSALSASNALINGVDPKKNPELAKAVASLSRTLFGVGAETSRGLAQGLLSQDAQLKAAMQHLGALMVGEIRKELGIHSPSKVGHDLGANFGFSIGAGALSQDRHVRASVRQLGRSAVSESQRALMSGRSGGAATAPFGVDTTDLVRQVVAGVMEQLPDRFSLEVDKRVMAKANREGELMLGRR